MADCKRCKSYDEENDACWSNGKFYEIMDGNNCGYFKLKRIT